MAATQTKPTHPVRQPLTRALILSTTLTVIVLAGCSSGDTTRSGLLEPYRTDLPQGNYLTRDLLDEVKPGMREIQVKRLLGSPLLVDVFQPQQQNYVFSFKHPSGRVDLRRVRIIYDDNQRVASIDADDLPPTESPSDPALPGFRQGAYDRIK